jgi:hypothetical protein
MVCGRSFRRRLQSVAVECVVGECSEDNEEDRWDWQLKLCRADYFPFVSFWKEKKIEWNGSGEFNEWMSSMGLQCKFSTCVENCRNLCNVNAAGLRRWGCVVWTQPGWDGGGVWWVRTRPGWDGSGVWWVRMVLWWGSNNDWLVYVCGQWGWCREVVKKKMKVKSFLFTFQIRVWKVFKKEVSFLKIGWLVEQWSAVVQGR